MKIYLRHPVTNQIKSVKLGFSWTMLFFGIFVPLIRGDWKWFFVSLALSIFTAGIAWLVLPFIYNKIYINDLLERGYIAADSRSESVLISKGIILD